LPETHYYDGNVFQWSTHPQSYQRARTREAAADSAFCQDSSSYSS